jgi:hypothetical protein
LQKAAVTFANVTVTSKKAAVTFEKVTVTSEKAVAGFAPQFLKNGPFSPKTPVPAARCRRFAQF